MVLRERCHTGIEDCECLMERLLQAILGVKVRVSSLVELKVRVRGGRRVSVGVRVRVRFGGVACQGHNMV